MSCTTVSTVSKPVNGIVIGMSAGDVSKCVVKWKSSTSDQYIDLPMSTRKLNNFFHPTYAGSRDINWVNPEISGYTPNFLDVKIYG